MTSGKLYPPKKKIAEIVEAKEHLTVEGVNKIISIRENTNGRRK